MVNRRINMIYYIRKLVIIVNVIGGKAFMKKILLTGKDGFWGTRFNKFYKDKYDLISIGHKDLDITDENKVIEVIKSTAPDYIIHSAAVSDTGQCEKTPQHTYKINVNGTVNIAKACELINAKMIFLSSDQVYNGNTSSGPYSEKDVTFLNTAYSEQKLIAEKEIEKILEEVWNLRLTWMFALPEKNCSIKPNLLWNVVNSIMGKVPCKAGVNDYRGITYVYDVIENIEKVFNIPFGTYNMGSENNLSTYEVAEYIVKKLNNNHRISEVLHKDEKSFKDNPRDLRICTKHIGDNGIVIGNTLSGIDKCLKTFTYV